MGSLSPNSGPRPDDRRRPSASSAEAPESCALSVYREAVAAAIREEDHDVGSITALLKKNVAWSRWPDRYRRLLMAAVTDEGEGMEAQKARAVPATVSGHRSGLAARVARHTVRRGLLCGRTPADGAAGADAAGMRAAVVGRRTSINYPSELQTC